jgi:hypothetical protein
MAANAPPAGQVPPGPAAGVPPAPPANAPAPAQLHQTYASLYGDTVRFPPNAPINRGPMNLMNILPGGLALTGSQIRAQISSNEDRVPQAWMTLSVNPLNPQDIGLVQIIHRHSFYGPPMGMPHDPDVHNRLYGLLGDLQAGRQFYNVIIPDHRFSVTANVRIPTFPVINQILAQDVIPPLMGPYYAADAGTEVVRTRNMCWLPPKYAAIALGRPPMDPMEFLTIVGNAIDTDGLMQELDPCLTWMRVAATRAAPGQPAINAFEALSLATPRPELTAHMWHKIELDLPNLGNTAVLMGATHIAGAVGALTNTVVNFKSEENAYRLAAKADKKMTVRKKWRHCLSELLKLTHCDAPEDVPPVWEALADIPAKTHRATVQSFVNAMATSLGYQAPLISPSFATTLTGVVTWRTDEYDVAPSTGFSIYNLVAKTAEHRQFDAQVAQSYDLCMDASTTVTQSDAVAFLKTGDTTPPSSLLHALETLCNAVVVLSVFLGTEHPLTNGLHGCADWCNQNKLSIQERMRLDPESWLCPAYMVHYFHKDIATWITLQLSSTLKLPSPNFMEWASKMLKGDSWKRPLPMVFLSLRDDPYSTVVSSASSAVSGLTTPTVSTQGSGSQLVIPPAGKALVAMGGMDQPLADQQAEFEPFRGISVKIGSVLEKAAAKNHPIPADDNGVPFCLSYHIRGKCYENCSRHSLRTRKKTQHRRLTAAELKTIVPWCVTHFVVGS